MKSKGLGDSIEKLTTFIGITYIVEKLSHVFGIKDCGCKRRKDTLNKKFPYKTPTSYETEQIQRIKNKIRDSKD